MSDPAQEKGEVLSELGQSQLELTRAQVRKAVAEATEAEKRLNIPWYKHPENLRLLILVLASSGLLAIWVVQYFEPILTAKQRHSELEIQIAQRNTEVQQLQNDEARRSLERQIVELQNQQETHRTTIEAAQAENSHLAQKYAALAKQQQLTVQERSEFAARAQGFEKENLALETELNTLKSRQAQTQALASSLSGTPISFGSATFGSTVFGGTGIAWQKGSGPLSGLRLTIVATGFAGSAWDLENVAKSYGAEVVTQWLGHSDLESGILYYSKQEDEALVRKLNDLFYVSRFGLGKDSPIKEIRRSEAVSQPTIKLEFSSPFLAPGDRTLGSPSNPK